MASCGASCFPSENRLVPWTPEEKGVRDKLVEANKSNVILLSWLVVAILSVWLKSDAGDMILSIAAGVVGLAFTQNQKVLESFSASDETLGTVHGVGHKILLCYCPALSIIGGLIFGNTASADGLGLAPALIVTILAGLLVLVIWYTMWDTRIKPEEDAEAATQNGEASKEIKEANKTRTKTKEEDLLTWLSFGGLACSLGLAILGTVLIEEVGGEIDIRWRLALLGMSVGFGLLTSVLCKIMDEKANGGALIEFSNIFLGVTVDVIPLAIELTLDENQNNPRVMTIRAWVSFGSAAIFFCLVKFSMWSEKKTGEEKKRQAEEAKKEPQQNAALVSAILQQNAGTDDNNPDKQSADSSGLDLWTKLWLYGQELDSVLKPKNEDQRNKYVAKRIRGLEQEKEDMNQKIQEMDRKLKILESRTQQDVPEVFPTDEVPEMSHTMQSDAGQTLWVKPGCTKKWGQTVDPLGAKVPVPGDFYDRAMSPGYEYIPAPVPGAAPIPAQPQQQRPQNAPGPLGAAPIPAQPQQQQPQYAQMNAGPTSEENAAAQSLTPGKHPSDPRWYPYRVSYP